MNRRTLISSGIAAITTISGCLDSSNNTDDSNPSDLTENRMRTSDDQNETTLEIGEYPPDNYGCDISRRPSSDQYSGNEEPRALEYPPIPDELTEQSVTEFVNKHEYVWARNELIKEYGSKLESGPSPISGSSILESDGGVYAEIKYSKGYSYIQDDQVVEVEGEKFLAIYYITPTAVFRDRESVTGKTRQEALSKIDLSKPVYCAN